MTKLLIVDDEQIERDGLQMILQKAFPKLVIQQAKNGKQAVRLAEDFRPDLILMDIKMPGMSGLEAVEHITAFNPAIKFVMVTAFDTFDYARQAIKLGVKDYLLKPSKVSEIVATVSKVLKEAETEKYQQDVERSQKNTLEQALTLVETDVVTQLLFDHVHEVHLDMLVEMLDIRSTNEKFVMSVLLPPGAENWYSAIKERVRLTKSSWVGAIYGRQLPIIVFREPAKSFRSQAISLAKDILSVAGTETRTGWFVGIGNVCGSLDEIRQSYQESLIATMDPALPVKYRFYTDVPVLATGTGGQHSKGNEKELFDFIRLGKWDEVRFYVYELIQFHENNGAGLLITQQRVLASLWIATRVMNELGIDADTPFYSFQAQDYRQLRTETSQLLDGMRRAYTKHYEQLEADTIHQIKQYISEHSHEDISLEMLGQQVNLSPIYISKMFKEKLGINYIDFLTECRIEKAKKLLGDPDKSIKEITFEVGYHEPNYFSKVFKKNVAASPKEYRNTLLGKKG